MTRDKTPLPEEPKSPQGDHHTVTQQVVYGLLDVMRQGREIHTKVTDYR